MGLFNWISTPKPPYDALTAEQRYALYFLLESFTRYMNLYSGSNAFAYLGKAAKNFGISEKQIKEFRPRFDTFEKIKTYIKQINNNLVFEYMISNCSTMFNLMEISPARTEFGEKVYQLYYELGYSQGDIDDIRWKHQYDDII